MEQQSLEKHAFCNGNVQQVAGANPIHNKIAARVLQNGLLPLISKRKNTTFLPVIRESSFQNLTIFYFLMQWLFVKRFNCRMDLLRWLQIPYSL